MRFTKTLLPLVLALGWISAVQAAPWRFVVAGDTRGSDSWGINNTIVPELAGQIVGMSTKPGFVLVPGDLVNAGNTTGAFSKWKEYMAPVYSAGIAVYPVIGNHDTSGLAAWNTVFGPDIPDNGPTGEINRTYAITYNNALILNLDSEVNVNYVNQTWINQQLALRNPATTPHVFAQAHRPLFHVSSHYDTLDNQTLANQTARNAFVTSLKNAGGRSYFTGHDHLYDHARLDDGGATYNDFQQFVVGSGGAPTNGAPSYSWGNWTNPTTTPTPVSYDLTYGYLTVDIDGPNATYTWYRRNTTDLGVAGTYSADDPLHRDVYSYVLGGVLWDGGATNGNWNSNNNWDSNAALVDGSALTFAGSVQTTTTNNSTLTHVGQVTLKGGFTCSGATTLALDAGMSNYLDNTWGINSTLSANQSFYGSSGTLTFSGTLDTNGKALSIDGPGNHTFSNAISGAGSLTKTGTGKLTLGGNNTYAGATAVAGGTLQITGSAQDTVGVTVAAGAILDLARGGSQSALKDTTPVANNGLLTVSTAGQALGTLSGSGSTSVAGNMSLTADSIVQNTLTIGAGATVTIRETTGGSANAVPEPGTWMLLAAGTVCLLPLVRRLKRRTA
jgi:autotransporter-associated beta strand protein